MNDVIKLIENFSLSEVVFVLFTLSALVSTICKIFKWVLNKLNWYHNKKNQEEDTQETLKTSTEQNEVQNNQIKEIIDKLNLLTDATVENLRYSITKVCEDYIERKYIASYELKDLENIFGKYESIHGNSYVHTLMKKVRRLEVNNHEE